MDIAITAAVVGALIAALVTVVVFTIDRVLARRAQARELRRVAFAEVIDAFTNFAGAAISSGGIPEDLLGPRLLAARSRMVLAMGVRSRILGFWVIGMESRIGKAAALAPTTEEEAMIRAHALEQVVGDLANSLIDLHQGRLLYNDFILPAGLFKMESEDPNILEANEHLFVASMRPTAHGRWEAIVQWAIRPYIKFRARRARSHDAP